MFSYILTADVIHQKYFIDSQFTNILLLVIKLANLIFV